MTRLEVEAFLTIMRCGSISAAAEKLYVTQPALSRRIRAIEEELGYDLLVRGKGMRSVCLTEEGTAFVAVAEKLNHIYHEAESIADLKQNPVLSLASVDSISTYLLPNILKQIVNEEKRYNLSFHNYHSRESYGYMENGMLDIALISDDMYSKSVITTPAFQEPFVLIGGPGWSSVTSIHPKDLDPRHEIRLPWNPEFDVWHEKWFDVTVYPRVQLDKTALLEEFLTEDSFAIVPLLVAENLKKRRHTICRIKDGPEDETIYYLTAQSHKKEIISHFLHLLHEEILKVGGIHSFLSKEF